MSNRKGLYLLWGCVAAVLLVWGGIFLWNRQKSPQWVARQFLTSYYTASENDSLWQAWRVAFLDEAPAHANAATQEKLFLTTVNERFAFALTPDCIKSAMNNRVLLFPYERIEAEEIISMKATNILFRQPKSEEPRLATITLFYDCQTIVTLSDGQTENSVFSGSLGLEEGEGKNKYIITVLNPENRLAGGFLKNA